MLAKEGPAAAPATRLPLAVNPIGTLRNRELDTARRQLAKRTMSRELQ